MALGPEHPGRVRAAGAGVSNRQYFNLPRKPRVKFEEAMEHRLRDAMAEQEKKLEARTQQIVAAERENLLNQLRHFISNSDPTMLKSLPIQPQ